jgi:TatD DNase family protein
VLHYFSGRLDDAQRYIDLGFLVSVHTSVTHPKAAALRDVVARLALETLVVETDSPYGAPQAFRGQRNEPAYVAEAVRQIAELHGVAIEQVARITSENALRLFSLPKAAKISVAEKAK